MDYKNKLRKKVNTNLSFFVVIIILFSYLIFTQINQTLLLKIIISSIFSFFLFLLFANLTYNSISSIFDKSTDVIEDGLNQLSHGNLSYRIDEIDNKFENINLVDNFNEMATSLELSIKTIEKHGKDLEIVIVKRTKSTSGRFMIRS